MLRPSRCLVALLVFYHGTFTRTVNASAVLFPPRRPAGACAANHYHSPRSRRSSIFPGTNYHSTTSLVARKTKKKKAIQKSENEPKALQEAPLEEISFENLGPVGKVIATTTELAVAVVWNYCQGYLTGLFFGTLIGVPGLAFRPVEKGVAQPFMAEFNGRFARMNTRSARFGKSFGSLSAIFKGSDTFVRRLRYGKNDAWNDILGSAVAGAIFGRQGR